MASNSARLWTLPLTALLFVNTILVGLAMRHVGLAGEPETIVAVMPDPIEPPPPQPAEAAIVDPPEGPDAEGTLTVWNHVADSAPDWYAGIAAGEVEVICPTAAPSTGDATPQATASTNVTPQASGTPEPEPTSAAPTIASTPPPNSADAQPDECRDNLIVVNPPSSGGVVHFVVDKEVVSLEPGELLRLPAKEGLRVQFHRGDDFGDAAVRCPCGVFAFGVGDVGWMLDRVEGQTAARLMKVCRPAPVPADAELD